jgi:NADH pyrophosphatase NudC (nudix superfamily)
MNKIVFANNPLDRMSSIRSDEEWQKTSMSSSDARYIIFDSGKPLIQVSKEPGSNSTIYLAKFDSIKKHFEACQIIFLGEMKNIKYYAIDITKQRTHFDIEILIGCKFIDLRSIAQSLSPEDTGILAQAKSMVEWNAVNIYCSRCETSKL